MGEDLVHNSVHGTFEANGDKFPATLPSLVTAGDVREVVRFLRRNPDGIPLVEANEAVRKRIFEPRKVSAYELWGILTKSGNRVFLSSLGWEYAARLALETEIYRVILGRTPAYHAALEWIQQSQVELVTNEEVAKFWRKQQPETIGAESSEAYADSFFDLCHAAEIGSTTAGRKGHPTRLRIYRQELKRFLSDLDSLISDPFTGQVTSIEGVQPASISQISAGQALDLGSSQRLLFVSHRRGAALLPRLKSALNLADLECKFAVREAGVREPLSGRVLEFMRQCQAGIIVITGEDCLDNPEADNLIEELVLVEIGAAFVHFDKRLVILAEKSARLPVSLHNLNCYRFEGDLPPWEVLVELVNSTKQLLRGVS